MNGHAGYVSERDEAHALWVDVDLVLYPDAPVPLFAQLARGIRVRIAHWGLEAGTLLPSEPAFAEQQPVAWDPMRTLIVAAG